MAKKPMTKAERILNAVRRGHEGKTASEIAKAAKVDHNHVYIMEKLVLNGVLKRKGGEQRELEPFETKLKGGRGVLYFKGRNFAKATGAGQPRSKRAHQVVTANLAAPSEIPPVTDETITAPQPAEQPPF